MSMVHKIVLKCDSPGGCKTILEMPWSQFAVARGDVYAEAAEHGWRRVQLDVYPYSTEECDICPACAGKPLEARPRETKGG